MAVYYYKDCAFRAWYDLAVLEPRVAMVVTPSCSATLHVEGVCVGSLFVRHGVAMGETSGLV